MPHEILEFQSFNGNSSLITFTFPAFRFAVSSNVWFHAIVRLCHRFEKVSYYLFKYYILFIKISRLPDIKISTTKFRTELCCGSSCNHRERRSENSDLILTSVLKVEKSNVHRLESLSKARRKTFKFFVFPCFFFERFSAEPLEFTEEEQTSSEKVEKSF